MFCAESFVQAIHTLGDKYIFAGIFLAAFELCKFYWYILNLVWANQLMIFMMACL